MAKTMTRRAVWCVMSLAVIAMSQLPTPAVADLPDTITRVKPSVVVVGTYLSLIHI